METAVLSHYRIHHPRGEFGDGFPVSVLVIGHTSVLPHESVFSTHSTLNSDLHSLHGRQIFGLLRSSETDKQPYPGQQSPWSPQTC